MPQAIITKFLGPTPTRGSRIKAASWRGSVTLPCDHALDTAANYRAAAQALCDKFSRMDRSTWQIIACAELPNEARDFVFIIDWVQVP